MSIFTNLFRSFRTNDVAPADKEKTYQPTISLKPTDKKIVLSAKVAIKGHKSDKFLNSISDFYQRADMKDDRNIFIHYLNADLKKVSITKNDLSSAVNYCVKRAEAGNVSESEQNEIRAFFDKYSYLPKEIFDRKDLIGGRLSLQRLLSIDLDQLIKLGERDPTLKSRTDYQLKVSEAKASLSVRLGHGVSFAGNGVNGAQIIRDLEGSPVGVFKPAPELKWYQIPEKLKGFFGQSRLLNQQDSLGQQYSEVAAHRFDEAMGFKLTPAATMTKLNGKEGAFLAFLKGYEELKECENKLEGRSSYEESEKKIWQTMCIYNFLVGNLDPHNQNIFVRMEESQLKEVRMIDHGNCFIEMNPGEWGSKGNQGHWGTYKISKEAFTPEVIEFVRTNLTEDKLDQFVKQIGKERENFWTIHMDQNQRERLQLIREGILQGKISSPKELSNIHTSNDFRKHLNKEGDLTRRSEQTDLGDFSILDIS